MSSVQDYQKKLQELDEEEKWCQKIGINSPDVIRSRSELRDSYHRMIRERSHQTAFPIDETGPREDEKYVYLELSGYKPPKTINRILHATWGGHHWLYYLDPRVLDCGRRICMICGYAEGTIMSREYGGYDPVGSFYPLNFEKLQAFVSSFNGERRTNL